VTREQDAISGLYLLDADLGLRLGLLTSKPFEKEYRARFGVASNARSAQEHRVVFLIRAPA
jgi:hypothetical protein